MAEVHPAPASGFRIDPVAAARCGLAAGQGLALTILFHVFSRNWSPEAASVCVPLALVLMTVPLILIQGWTGIPHRTLWLWAVLAGVLIAGLGFYDAWRRGADALNVFPRDAWPSPPLRIGVVAMLFVGQALIAASASEGRVLARYGTYFDIATKQLVQMAAGIAFVISLVASLILGGILFKQIGVTAFSRLLGEFWFDFPVIAFALALAVHVTDVNPSFVRGLRTLALTLLAWLLPVMTAIVAAFVLTLPFTGLAGLWSTGHATALLLGIAVVLMVLINAAYQDGTRVPSLPIRLIGRIAAVLLAPLVFIAGYALALRVGQYGWSTDRIIALAGVIVGAAMAVGYAIAAFSPGPWLARIAVCNVGGAALAALMVFALLSPVLDPARISVASQVARLHAGQISPEQFDYAYLRFSGGRYGAQALEALKADPSSEVRDRAAQAESQPQPRRRAPF